MFVILSSQKSRKSFLKCTQFYKPKTLIMEHTITNFKRASLFLLLFYAVFSSQDMHAQVVTEIVTDYQGYWKSGPGAALNPVKPQNSHDLLSFTFNGQRYSTGVNDALLTTRGDAFSAQKFIALPMNNMSGIPTAETFIGVGQLYDGVNNGPSSPPPLNNLAYYLTDGVQGLNIGTCATNIPQGYVSFQVSHVDPQSIGDGIPDILITQVAQPSGATDIYAFKDVNGNNVGSSVNIVLNDLQPVGNWIADFYKVNSNPMIIPAGFVNTERPMRLWAADFSDFGITPGNYESIDHFVINLKGTTDIAFVAYNIATATVVPLTPGISLLKEGTFVDVNNDCRASIGDKVNYTFKVTNTGQAPLTNITISDPLVTVTGGPIALAAGASNSTAFTASYFITQADITAGAVYNRATVRGTDPQNVVVTKDSSDPTPIAPSNPLFHADCPECTVTPLIQTPTITLPIAALNFEGCSTAAITGLIYSETAVSITPAQFIALGGTISNVSLVLNITYQDTQSGTCPIVVTREFKVTSGCLTQRFTQVINVNDTVKPTADALADFTVTGCNAAFPAADVALVTGEADNCTTAPTVTFVGDSAPVATGCTETVIRTYKVADACGNFIEVHQNLIRTADTVLPTASNPANVVLVNNEPVPAADVLVVTDEADNCSVPTVTFISDSTPVTERCTETVIRTYRVTDACDNHIDVTQRFVRNLTTSAPVIGEVIQPTCRATFGSIVISGLPAGNWTITQTGTVSTTYSNTGATYTVQNLFPGMYTFTFTADGCTSNASVEVTINRIPDMPNAPLVGAITQPTCNVPGGTVVLSGLPATGTWTISEGTEVVATGTGTSTTLTDLAAGTHNYTVTVNTDCTSSASANVVISPSANPTAPVVVSVSQPTCAAAIATVQLSGLPTGNWTIAEIGLTGNGSAPITVSLAAGTYTLVVTNSEGCNSLPLEIPLVINPQPTAPNAPVVGTVTQPGCTSATGSIELTGLPSGNWTINGVPGSGPTTVISGVSTGTYTYTVTVGDCISAASIPVTINAVEVLAAPIVGTVTQPTCASATGSVELSGLPSGNWTINGVSGSGPAFTFPGLAEGTYTFTVTSDAGCISAASASVTINAQPATPAAPAVGTTTQPTCALATGSVVLSGLPSGNWTITQTGTVTNTYTATGETFDVDGLAPGTYNFTIVAGACESAPSQTVTINAASGSPSAPVIGTVAQPTCAVQTGSVTLSGLPAGTWTISYGSTTLSGTGETFLIGGLTVGDYTFSVMNALGCNSVASASVTINAAGENVNLNTYARCNSDIDLRVNLASLLPDGTPTNGTWTASGEAAAALSPTGIFTPNGLDVAFYNVNYNVSNAGCSQTFAFNVEVDDDCLPLDVCSDPIIPNAFSPNGDLLNDVFVINNLESINCYPTNKIEIFNRWGVLVYDAQQYDNTSRVFKGYSEGRATMSKSEQLPTGTYFYVLEYLDARDASNVKTVKKQGYLYLTK